MTPQSFCEQYKSLLPHVPKIALLGIRGYTSVPNVMGVYDDAICRYIDGELKVFTASVDPGKLYIKNPIHPQGCAKLCSGLWWYKLGEHNAKKALTQVEPVDVERLDPLGRSRGKENGFFGINIHSGGPEYLVGRYSAGCQIIKADEPWQCQWTEFYEPLAKYMLDNKLTRIPYLLVDTLKASSLTSGTPI